MPNFLVIGESVADVVRTSGHPDVPHPGGSPANVAYGLARLGRPTALLTQLGADAAGELIGAHLRSAGVELLPQGQLPGLRTPTAIVSLDAGGRASYTFDIHWSLPPAAGPLAEPAGPAPHLHFGSIAALLAPGAAPTLDLVACRRARATVSYDPNIRPALLADPAQVLAQVERCVALSDLVKASDEDLAWLYPHRTPQEVAADWLTLGPAAVLVTRGGQGAFARSHAAGAELPARQAAVVDTVGAGDSFMSATLDALAARALLGPTARPALRALDERALTELLRHATTAAAVTVSRPGANPPDTRELATALAARP
ncbi:carbohydrate kinase [Kitasatospora sp. NBC_01287]|uniref:carbohydrate kinase family protein n=1 Tax=Kitasatospora sp. NBC_01287 TaxID=2903573 RepID=UPI0022515BA9|nr:carbohydrate kinase [Kitasatospora sp. NBC_01287]MCX4744560.1 carbohydrate kinase [Kitasatospora sp. NBC_01287]